MQDEDSNRPRNYWHEVDLALRGQDLEREMLEDLEAARTRHVREMEELWGPEPPPEVRAEMDRVLSMDLLRKAETMARNRRIEVRRNLEAEMQTGGDAAFAGTIDRAVSMYEEIHGIHEPRTIEQMRASKHEIRTVELELARAENVYAKRPSAALRAAINRWKYLQQSGSSSAYRRLARFPLATLHDWDMSQLFRGHPFQREAAVTSLIDRGFIAPGAWFDESLPGRRRAKEVLKQRRDEQGHQWVYDWLKTTILPAALFLAVEDAKSPNAVRIRLNRRWLVDLAGKQALVAAWDLSDADLVEWLRTRAMQRAEEGILGEMEVSREETVSLFDPIAATERQNAEETDGQSIIDVVPSTVPDPYDVLSQAEREQNENEQLGRFLARFESLPYRDQQLVTLRANGKPYEEIANLLGSTSAALRKRLERVKKDFRRTLIDQPK